MESTETKSGKMTRRRLLRLLVLSAVGCGIVPSASSLVGATLAVRGEQDSGKTSDSSSGDKSRTAPAANDTGGPSSSSSQETTVKVMYFQMPLVVSAKEEYFVLQNPAYFRDLRTDILEKHPALSRMMPSMMVLIDGLPAQAGTALKDGDEVDIIPAFAGG